MGRFGGRVIHPLQDSDGFQRKAWIAVQDVSAPGGIDILGSISVLSFALLLGAPLQLGLAKYLACHSQCAAEVDP